MAKIENIRWLSGFVHGLGEFAVKQGRKTLYGLINTAGEIILEPQPKMLHIRDEKQVMLFRDKRIKGDRDIVLNLETREIYSAERYYAEKYGSAITLQKGNGYGTVDVDGNTIIPHQYRILDSSDGLLFVACNRKNKYGILDNKGDEKCAFAYDQISYYCDLPLLPDRISVRQGAEWFVIDREGHQLTQRRGTLSGYYVLETVTPRGFAIFSEMRYGGNMFYGVLDVTRDEIVIPAGYAELRWLDRYPGGWAKVVARKDDFGLTREEVLTLDGEYALPQVYGGISDYYGGKYIVRSCAGGIYPDVAFCGVIHENGDTILPFEFSLIRRYDDIYKVCRSDTQLYGLCSLTGETILPCEYSYIDIGDTLDYIAVCKDGEWYYINKRKKRILL